VNIFIYIRKIRLRENYAKKINVLLLAGGKSKISMRKFTGKEIKP